jgi:reverse gyrase
MARQCVNCNKEIELESLVNQTLCNSCKESYLKEKKKLEEDFDVLNHQYSYPTFQLKELRKKYKLN